MNLGVYFGIFALALGASFYMTGRARVRLAGAAILDLPNERSLHAQPTPRGGGVVFAALTSLAHAGALALEQLPLLLGVVGLVAGAGFALLGWWDDRRSLPTLRRLLAQFLLASVFVIIAAWSWRHTLSLPQLLMGGCAALLAIIWSVNLFNFMDGADGYAATQAVTAAGGGALLFHLGGSPALAALALCFAGACAGFLMWNWPPARLFMGDAGSYFLGFHFVALAALGAATRTTAVVCWLILLAPFITDATLTLMRRLLRGERFWQAHRSHAYQKLILNGWPPARVTLALGLFVIVCGWPCALLASFHAEHGLAYALPVYALSGMIWLAIDRRTP